MKKVLIALLAIACIFSVVSCNDECEHENLTHHAAQASTCVEYGNIEYWECEDCHVKFSDEAATTPVEGEVTLQQLAAHTLSHHDATVTCKADGNIEYWDCSVCSGKFSNSTGTTAITSTSATASAAYHNPDATTHICSACSNYIVSTWAEFATAVASTTTNIALGADIAWDNTVATIDLTGKTLDLFGCGFTGLSASSPAVTGDNPVPAVPMTVITGDSFTIKNGTISGTDDQQGMLLIGTEYATAVAVTADVSAADSTKPINITDVTFTNAGLIIGIKYVNVKNVTATCKSTAIMFNGASGTVENVSATTTSTSAAALEFAGCGTASIKGTNTLNGVKIGLKAHKGPSVDVDGGTTNITVAQATVAEELAIQIYESARLTIMSGATVNMTTDANQKQGAIGLANAYKGTRGAGITVKSGGTLTLSRADKDGDMGKLFWPTNGEGRFLNVFESGSSIKINGVEMAIISADEVRPVQVTKNKVKYDAVYNFLTSGTPADPVNDSTNHLFYLNFYDFRSFN